MSFLCGERENLFCFSFLFLFLFGAWETREKVAQEGLIPCESVIGVCWDAQCILFEIAQTFFFICGVHLAEWKSTWMTHTSI